METVRAVRRCGRRPGQLGVCCDPWGAGNGDVDRHWTCRCWGHGLLADVSRMASSADTVECSPLYTDTSAVGRWRAPSRDGSTSGSRDRESSCRIETRLSGSFAWGSYVSREPWPSPWWSSAPQRNALASAALRRSRHQSTTGD